MISSLNNHSDLQSFKRNPIKLGEDLKAFKAKSTANISCRIYFNYLKFYFKLLVFQEQIRLSKRELDEFKSICRECKEKLKSTKSKIVTIIPKMFTKVGESKKINN